MSNLIQIKRSLDTSVPATLANGELAFTANGDVLYVGSNSTIVAIGGKRVPGTLTANQALVANATSYLDAIKVANATIDKIYANGAHGSTSQILTSNSTGGIFWQSPQTAAVDLDGLTDVVLTSVSSGQILVSNSTGFFRNKSLSGDITVDADGVVSIAADSVALGTDTTGNYVATITAGNGLSGNGTTEGSTPTIAVVAGDGITSNSTGVFVTDGDGLTVNSTGVHVGAGNGLSVNSTAVAVIANNGIAANSTGVFVVAGSGVASNATGVHVVAGDGITSNTTGVFVTDGDGLSVNSTGVHVGAGNGLSVNSTAVAVVAGSGVASNATGVHVVAGDGITSNATGVFVTDGDGLTVNSTGVHVGAGNGLIVNSTAVAVVANNGIASNSTGVFVVAGTGVTSNATGVHIGQAVGTTDNVTFNDVTINGNTTIGSSSADVLVVNGQLSSNIIPSANITYSLGNNTLRFLEVHAQNTHSEYLYIDKDVSVSGNLTVTGSLVTINVATLSVTDSLIQLASNNTTSDSLDIGFYGNYQVGGGAHEHAGLFRDASTDTFKLFKGLQDAPTTTVDTSGTGYTQASLEAYLSSGALVSNSTAVTLTANSTVAVNMTANSLSLSTPLPGTSGGTGLASYTAEDILVANSTNGFRKLALGTDGYVLQSNGTAIVYGTLDGGSF